MNTAITKQKLESMAAKVGAFRPIKYNWFNRDYSKGLTFSYHYFNKLGLEIGYYIPDMGIGLLFESPRQWGEAFLNKLDWGYVYEN